jgi:hypothetical protein
MNKKLLCSTALAGALIVSGSALAELKIGGNFTHTTNFGSDDRSATTTNSGERLGTEMNLILSKTANLNNGMIATYRGVIEFDEVGSVVPDVEYEATIGTKDFYIGLGSDAGNNLASTIALPAVGQHIGTLAQHVSQANPLNFDSVMENSEANNESHVSLNAKAAGGTFSLIYTPNTDEGKGDNDSANINASAGGSAMAFLYTGTPVPNVGFIIGRNEEKGELDTADNEITIDKIGASYNFGKIRAGYEYQQREEGSGEEKTVDNFSVTFAASDSLTLGAQYSKGDINNAGTHEEKIMALSAGYNLGGASIAVSLVDVENLGATDVSGIDTQGVVITTKIGF